MIKWNEVTWYSKWGAIILFLGIVPVLCFYIGIQYQAATISQIIPIHLSTSLNNVQKPKPSLNKISFSDMKVGAYSFEGPKIEVLYQSENLVRDTVSFDYGGISYQILSNNISPSGKQAPTLFAHKIQYLDSSSNAWIDLTGQSELGGGFNENVGYKIVAYKNALFIVASARQGFHSDEILGLSGTTLTSYKKISDSNVLGFVTDSKDIYLQIDKGLCSDWPDYSCAQYYKFNGDGTILLEKVQIPGSFLQQQG
jgi:hypothetical protein